MRTGNGVAFMVLAASSASTGSGMFCRVHYETASGARNRRAMPTTLNGSCRSLFDSTMAEAAMSTPPKMNARKFHV